MKRNFLVLTFIFIAATAAAQKQTPRQNAVFCFAPFEWCLTGCPEIAAYSIESFISMAEAQSFVTAALTPLQQETVRVAAFPVNGKRFVVAYRVTTGTTAHTTAPIGICGQQATVTLRSFAAIETAAVEADHLPIEQRASIALFSVLPVHANDPDTRALLLFARQEAEHGDIDQ